MKNTEPFFRLKQGIFNHPKIRRLTNTQKVMYLYAIDYSASQRTDGEFYTADVERDCGGKRRDVEALFKWGLWEPLDDERALVHDYPHYQQTRKEIEELSEKRRGAVNARWNRKSTNPEPAPPKQTEYKPDTTCIDVVSDSGYKPDTEEEIEIEEEVITPPNPPKGGKSGDRKPAAKEKTRAVAFPKDWEPTTEDLQLAINNGLDPDEAVPYFKRWAGNTTRRYKNWHLTWQNACVGWMKKELADGTSRAGRPSQQQVFEEMQRMAAVADTMPEIPAGLIEAPPDDPWFPPELPDPWEADP